MAPRMPSHNAVSKAEVRSRRVLQHVPAYFPTCLILHKSLSYSHVKHTQPPMMPVDCPHAEVHSCCTPADGLANTLPRTRAPDRCHCHFLGCSGSQRAATTFHKCFQHQITQGSSMFPVSWQPWLPCAATAVVCIRQSLVFTGERQGEEPMELKRENWVGIISPSSYDVHCYEGNLWK